MLHTQQIVLYTTESVDSYRHNKIGRLTNVTHTAKCTVHDRISKLLQTQQNQ